MSETHSFLLEAAAPPRPTRAPGTEMLARLCLPLFPGSSAEALPPAWASTCAGGGRQAPLPRAPSAQLQAQNREASPKGRPAPWETRAS